MSDGNTPQPAVLGTYSKIYLNGEVAPPNRIPTHTDVDALQGYEPLVAAMAFAVYVESRGTMPCPGRTLQGCGGDHDECNYCGNVGEVSILASPTPDPDQHPDPFVRGVVNAVRELLACDQARRGLAPPSKG